MENGIVQLYISETTDEISKFRDNYTTGIILANELNNALLPIVYKLEKDNFIESEITVNTKQIAKVSFYVACCVIYLTIKYKFKGFLSGISNFGYTGLILLTIRYGNVVLTFGALITYVFLIGLNMIYLDLFTKKL